MYSRIITAVLSLVVLATSGILADAQTKRKKTTSTKKPAAATSATPEKVEPKPIEPPVEIAVKRNERPADKPTSSPSSTAAKIKVEPAFRYEFTQPDFLNSKIIIEHDEKGVGTISFARRGGDEMFTDPLTVSANALKRLNDNFMALNFLDTAESFQFAKDYSHLGNIRITLNRGGNARTTAFNYTLNKHAKALADEYRAISNQAIWVFDITISRENQPLESPGHMKSLEAMIKRNEISDPEQMVPFLTALSNDERLPLIARNNATRIIESIQKAARKGK